MPYTEMDIMMVRLPLLLDTFIFIDFWQEETFGPVVGIQRVRCLYLLYIRQCCSFIAGIIR